MGLTVSPRLSMWKDGSTRSWKPGMHYTRKDLSASMANLSMVKRSTSRQRRFRQSVGRVSTPRHQEHMLARKQGQLKEHRPSFLVMNQVSILCNPLDVQMIVFLNINVQ